MEVESGFGVYFSEADIIIQGRRGVTAEASAQAEFCGTWITSQSERVQFSADQANFNLYIMQYRPTPRRDSIRSDAPRASEGNMLREQDISLSTHVDHHNAWAFWLWQNDMTYILVTEG